MEVDGENYASLFAEYRRLNNIEKRQQWRKKNRVDFVGNSTGLSGQPFPAGLAFWCSACIVRWLAL